MNRLLCGMFALLVCIPKVSLTIVSEKDLSRNISNPNATDIEIATQECPGLQWWNGERCIPCRTECPRYMYISEKCTNTTDAQCTKCIKTTIYFETHPKAGGTGSRTTWKPQNIDACEKENGPNYTDLIICLSIFPGILAISIICYGCYKMSVCAKTTKTKLYDRLTLVRGKSKGSNNTKCVNKAGSLL